jgi:molecular chaperone HtpG
VEHSPALEAFRHREWDVLLLTDPVDAFVFPALPEYRGKAFKAADRHRPEREEASKEREEEDRKAFAPLLDALRTRLPGIKDVRLTRTLTESASCLAPDEDALDPHLERLLQKMGQGAPGGPRERILEVNPEHPVVKGLQDLQRRDAADPRLEAGALFLHEEALLAEGSRLPDPTAFLRRLNALLARDLG